MPNRCANMVSTSITAKLDEAIHKECITRGVLSLAWKREHFRFRNSCVFTSCDRQPEEAGPKPYNRLSRRI
jgi:hypothetical protein